MTNLTTNDLIEKHGCKACRDHMETLIEISNDLIKNGREVIELGWVEEGRCRERVGMIMLEWAECIAIDSRNTPASALLAETKDFLKKMGIDAPLSKRED